MENIQLRNLYITKIQKQLNKTINSIDLLHQLQNVINQSGGSNKTIEASIIEASIKEAKDLLAIDKSSTPFAISSGVTYSDNRLQELEGALGELETLIINLRSELKNKSGSNVADQTRIAELEKTKADLENQIKSLTEDKEKAEKSHFFQRKMSK